MSDASFTVTELRNEILWTVANKGGLSEAAISMAISEIRDLKIKTRQRYLRRWVADGFLRSDKLGIFKITNRGMEILRRTGQAIYRETEKQKQTEEERVIE